MVCDATVAPVGWLFPGQGSQWVGMGRELMAHYPPAAALLRRASELAGADLEEIVLRGPERELCRTDLLQPALTAISMGCCLCLQEQGLQPDIVAGHSLGEFAALFAAGVLSADDALTLVVARGQLMHQAAKPLQGGLLAVKGLPVAGVDALLAAMPDAQSYPLVIANINAAAQTVVSGSLSQLSRLAGRVAAAGGQSVALNVSGPWHNPVLRPAALAFSERLDHTAFSDPTIPLVMNTSGRVTRSVTEIRAMLNGQMYSPVQWHDAMLAMAAFGVKRFVEVGPRRVLRGLLRLIPEVANAACTGFESPHMLPAVQRFYPPGGLP